MLTEERKKVTFSDVAGLKQLAGRSPIIEFERSEGSFVAGRRIPKGVRSLVSGHGQNLLAKAIAGEAGVPFFSISGLRLRRNVRRGRRLRVRDLFEQG